MANGVRSFQTAQGSIYTYDASGRTTRYKTATHEQMVPQDVTVFANLSLQQEQEFLEAHRGTVLRDGKRVKVYVAEKQPDGTGRIIEHLDDIDYPDKLALVGIDGKSNGRFGADNVVMAVGATLDPTLGMNTFDTRSYRDGEGTFMRERHLGNKVTEIEHIDRSISSASRAPVTAAARTNAALTYRPRTIAAGNRQHQTGSLGL